MALEVKGSTPFTHPNLNTGLSSSGKTQHFDCCVLSSNLGSRARAFTLLAMLDVNNKERFTIIREQIAFLVTFRDREKHKSRL